VASHRALLQATGEDRADFLQGMLSNDVKALAPGAGLYAALLTQQGRVVSDLRVFADADRLLLDMVAWRRDAVREALERFIVADDVELTVPTDILLVGLVGPFASAVAAELFGVAEQRRPAYSLTRSEFQGAPVWLMAMPEV